MIRPGILAALSVLTLSWSARAQTSTVNMQFGGKARNYILHLPTGGGSSLPLMFILHGHGMTAAQQQSSVKMDVIADREKFIVAYPNGIDGNWDQSGDSDWKFIMAVLDSIDAKYHIDKNRVYLAGFSQGAGMAHAAGCLYSDKLAGIAPASGNIPANCKPTRPISMMLSFGTGSDIATPEKFMQSATTWATLNGCPATPTVIHPYPASNPSSVVGRVTWGPCKNGTEVVVDSVRGGGHEWPMNTSTKINNSEEVWSFFKKFTLSGVTAVPRPAVAAGHGSISASYANGMVRLLGAGDEAEVRVLDHRGSLVARGVARQGRFAFKDRPAGVYQVLVGGAGAGTALSLVIP